MVEKTTKEEEKPKEEDTVELTEVVTGTAPAWKIPGIVDEEGKPAAVGMEQLLTWIAQQIYHIKKNTG